MRRAALCVLLLACSGSEDGAAPIAELDSSVDTAQSPVDTTTPDDTAATDGAVDTTPSPETATDAAPDVSPDAPCSPCGTGCCTATETCLFGMCVSCGAMLACEGACVDHQNNPEHCGACSKKCGAGEVCVAGACVADCPSGRTECSGWCRDTKLDPNHCGACMSTCPVRPGSSIACVDGKCALSCYPGYADCNGVESDGCEVRTTSHKNCGECGKACGATEVCLAGGTCAPGKYLFATKAVTSGSLGGYSGADAKCQAAAVAAGLPGTYLAWMNVPATRFAKSSSPYVLANGAVVASNWTDLVDAKLTRALNLDEYGAGLTGSAQVWADADAKGLAFFTSKNCAGWNSGFASSRGSFGISTATDESWAGRISQDSECLAMRHLYCVQQ